MPDITVVGKLINMLVLHYFSNIMTLNFKKTKIQT